MNGLHFFIYVVGAFIASAIITDIELIEEDPDPLFVGMLALMWPILLGGFIGGVVFVAIGKVGDAIVNLVRRY